MNLEEQIEQINLVIDKIKPYLNSEGGDIEFVKFENGIVYVRMMGACLDCMMLDDTLKGGVEAISPARIITRTIAWWNLNTIVPKMPTVCLRSPNRW